MLTSARFANPAPLGLLAFAATTFVLSMYNVQARHITHSNVILGMALGYGGLVELIAGVEEWASGNTFAATAFTSYGGLWLSFGTLYIPQFNVTGGSSLCPIHDRDHVHSTLPDLDETAQTPS